MKRLIIISMLSLVPLVAQQQTLFSGPYSHGGYGGPRLMVSTINGELGILVGGHGGWVMNHSMFIGGGGYGLVNQIKAPTAKDSTQRYVDFGYVGVELGAILASNSIVHLRVSTLIGGGGLSTSWRDNYYEEYDHHGPYYSGDAFFMAEPTVEMVVNMTPWMRLTAGASYRYIDGIETDSDLSDADFTGPSAMVSLNFGKF